MVPNTTKHYSGAIRTISNELYSLGLIETDIYHITDQDTVNSLVDIYLNEKTLTAKDLRGNAMYTNALKRYIEFFPISSTLAQSQDIALTFKDTPKSNPAKSNVVIIQ